MSTTKTRLPLAEAEQLATEVVDLLRQACERIEIAGSIRRRKATIGDLEIVCIPKVHQVMGGLFGDQPELTNLLEQRVWSLLDAGAFGKRLDKNDRPAVGEKYKRLSYKGMGLDLFSILPGGKAQWGVIFLIRTGSAEFSHRLVTPREQGGWMPSGLYCHQGAIWRNAEIVPTPEEEQVFELLGREYVEPHLREVK